MLLAALCSVVRADSVVHSKHDLSARGPGPVRALNEQEVCIFCHTPHNSQPQSALWNRELSKIHYRIYDSSTTDARVGQPSGPSKMCLSCHDGSIALGNLLSLTENQESVVMTSRTIPPGGPSDLGNDLSDDHPIGFRYDRALSSIDRQIRDPELVSRELPMGAHGEVHCTTCHDPHDNENGDFLIITDRRGTLCTTCHDMDGWRLSSHATSPARTTGRLVDPTDPLKYLTVADNACLNCHKIHSADPGERLLRHGMEEEDGCINCHNGTVATTNILGEIRKSSAHRGTDHRDIHNPDENPLIMRQHVECVDCHNPHAARAEFPTSPNRLVTPPLAASRNTGVPGVTALGAPTEEIKFQYQLCFKCHADNVNRPRSFSEIRRQVSEPNIRLDFQPNNPSFHPILRARNSSEVPSLVSSLSPSTVMSCTDCHNSDSSPQAGGSGPDGPHGSIYEPLLLANYDTDDFTTESAQAYALCYRCHDRDSILGNESFTFHRVHIVDAKAPCSACHDPHGVRAGAGGSRAHTALINFDLSVVRPVNLDVNPRLGFTDTGRFSGSCNLVCHEITHVGFVYP